MKTIDKKLKYCFPDITKVNELSQKKEVNTMSLQLIHGNPIYITHHAIQRRLEAEGIETSLVLNDESNPVDRKRRASVRCMMLNELAESELLSYQHSLLFRHPKRHQRADDAEYRITSNRYYCYVVKDGRVVTVIAVTKNQIQTLADLLGDVIPPMSVEREGAASETLVTQITRKNDISGYEELKTLIPTLKTEMTKLWMVIGLVGDPPIVASEKLKRMIKTLFEIFDYDMFRVVYKGRVIHLHNGENVLGALKCVNNIVPTYKTNIGQARDLNALRESSSVICPTIIIIGRETAINICLAISHAPETLSVPESKPWLAYFVHSATSNLEGSVALGKKFNFST